jgi:hypothetical protein
MIPEANQDHVVLRTRFEPINDLIKALQDANILPRRVPRDGGMGELRRRIDRLDLEFVLHYRLFFDDMRIDAYVDPQAPGGNEVRLGVPLHQGAIDVSAVEISTGRELSRFQYAISGRALIYGSIESNSGTGAPDFVISRLPEFKLDDASDRIPPLLPAVHTEAMLARVMNREVRAQPSEPARPFLIRIPITFTVHDTLHASPLTYGMALRDPLTAPDPMSKQLCLPTGYGNPACGTAPNSVSNFYQNLDSFMRVATAADPVALAPYDRTVQLNVGWRVIDRELSRDNGWEDWKQVALLFRFRTGVWKNWRRHADGRGSVYLEFKAELQVAYPKVKWCRGWTKLPWGGRVTYDYPCGVEIGWHGLKSMRFWADVRLEMQGEWACLQLLDKGASGSDDIIGYLLTALYLIASAFIVSLIPLIGDIVAGTIASAGIIVMSVLFSVEKVIGLILHLLPKQICANIEDFLNLPLFDDKLQVHLNNGIIEFQANGLLVAVNPDFKATLPAPPALIHLTASTQNLPGKDGRP